MPDRRRVSLAPVNTLAPSGIRSLMRVRAAAAASRISTVKPCAVSAAAVCSRRCSGAGSANSVAAIGGSHGASWTGSGVAGRRAQVVPDRRGPARGAVTAASGVSTPLCFGHLRPPEPHRTHAADKAGCNSSLATRAAMGPHLPAAVLDALLTPLRDSQHDRSHLGESRSHLGIQAFEKLVGTAGFEPATP